MDLEAMAGGKGAAGGISGYEISETVLLAANPLPFLLLTTF